MTSIIIFIVISLICASGINYIVSLFLMSHVRSKMSLDERIKLSSMDDADTIKLKSEISLDEKNRLWSDAMNIVVTAETEDLAQRYIDKAVIALGEEGKQFRDVANSIVRKRFSEVYKATDQMEPEHQDV